VAYKHRSGAQKRKDRVARGLPAYTEGERASRKRRNVATRRELVAEVSALKVARGCADCGFNKHPEALDFDHLPGAVKLGGVGYLLARNGTRETVFAEIAKCEVVCANCHRIRTAERRLAPGLVAAVAVA
jgi:hypothetical protein